VKIKLLGVDFMILVFLFIVCLGYLIYLRNEYYVNTSLKDDEEIYKIKKNEDKKKVKFATN
jgi:Tfp pilus assembly protein PilO